MPAPPSIASAAAHVTSPAADVPWLAAGFACKPKKESGRSDPEAKQLSYKLFHQNHPEEGQVAGPRVNDAEAVKRQKGFFTNQKEKHFEQHRVENLYSRFAKDLKNEASRVPIAAAASKAHLPEDTQGA